MDPSQAEIEARWRRWLVERNRRGLRIGLIIMITLYPAFGLLDWLLAPPRAVPWLWATRALVTVVTLVLFPVLRTRFFERWGELVSATYVWLAAGAVAAMTSTLGGLSSPYYAGLSLILLSAGLLLVWRLPVVVVTHSAVVATFIVGNAVAGQIGPAATVSSNLAFLCTTALVAAVGQVLFYRTQREQMVQRVRLERITANLERAHADLQQLDQFKSRFFANMTHELRTPLAMVLTPLELLLQGEMGTFSEAQRNAFGSMFKSALKLLKLINDLLDLSRLEESRLRLDIADHDLVAPLRTLTEQTQVLAQRKDISLAFRASADRLVVRGDLERLERVFVNLLSNAIKFTPPGGHVRLSALDGEGAVSVVVEDDGPGFPPEAAEKIFERFYQVDMAGTRRHGGAGIGLALARELVQLHGGTLVATSDGRSGARFVATLPKDAAHLPAATAPERAAGADGGLDWAVQLANRTEFRLLDIDEATERRVVERDADEEARPYTAIVVEDNPQVIQVVHMTLRREFKVFTAPDGLKGLEIALRERPNLVVTDLMMPGIDGLELTRRLQADPRTRHVPVLMLTARGELDDRVQGLETGVSAYLTKPFSPRELVTCARQLVRAEEQTADLVLTHRMESVEIVAAGLAHELNNPLNYVKNALARVRDDAAQAVELVRAARSRALEERELARLDRAAERIADMLCVADAGLRRIGQTVELMGRYGRAGFRREVVPHDAWAAVRTVVDVVLPATGRPVQVDVELSGDGTVECVPEELNQVVTNLVQNAIEAAPETGGRVSVTGRADDGELVLSVKDNGGGIPPAVLGRIFTPFFTTKGPGRGMGLGLTITRRVVQGLGGSLQVSSLPGEGAEFVVRLPRRRG
ncbi:ATP-binding protein [Anaeromyxobacter oryzae]|uniref:histidine kinase n=1 Tax=Anaeromyxobacter oryzae TaxID=2918170 RepID=A0ABM7X0W9_9BACT|nr:ATP-binding protein [Anaeromyxobacter oryzae]BDG05460.1 ATPase [Anaeromyxobacter oryzae]